MEPIGLNGTVVTLTPTTSNDTDAIPKNCRQVRIYNAGSVAVFVATSPAETTTAATTTSTCIPPGVVETFSVPPSHQSIGAICASGSATVYITCGPGF
jgi:hypothetical protein